MCSFNELRKRRKIQQQQSQMKIMGKEDQKPKLALKLSQALQPPGGGEVGSGCSYNNHSLDFCCPPQPTTLDRGPWTVDRRALVAFNMTLAAFRMSSPIFAKVITQVIIVIMRSDAIQPRITLFRYN